MSFEMLIPNNRERTINALARNNNIIKSLFYYDKQITFLIISLAIQKIKANAHKEGGLVIITRPEIQSLASGRDAKNGINKLIKLIRSDLEVHSFFNFYNPNSGLKDIRQGLIQKTALTKDMLEDLIIHFNKNMFDVFKSKENYTIQSLNQLKNCKENQSTIIYTLTQPYAKPNSPDLQLRILELRLYLRISDDAYKSPKTLTMRIKKVCEQISNKTDINLTVYPIKKNGITGVTVGYQFHSEFKKQKNTVEIEEAKNIKVSQLSIRQQLSDWGVGKNQIDTWLAILDKKTINNAINQTINRTERENKKSNPGGYIYSILGNEKQLQSLKCIKYKEVVDCLKKFGLNDDDIKKAQKKTGDNNNLLTAVTNQCLRELANDVFGTDDMRQFFYDQLYDACNVFIRPKK